MSHIQLLPTHPSINLPIYPAIHLSVHPSICPSIHPSNLPACLPPFGYFLDSSFILSMRAKTIEFLQAAFGCPAPAPVLLHSLGAGTASKSQEQPSDKTCFSCAVTTGQLLSPVPPGNASGLSLSGYMWSCLSFEQMDRAQEESVSLSRATKDRKWSFILGSRCRIPLRFRLVVSRG